MSRVLLKKTPGVFIPLVDNVVAIGVLQEVPNLYTARPSANNTILVVCSRMLLTVHAVHEREDRERKAETDGAIWIHARKRRILR